MKISVIVTLKKDVLDPQGKTIKQALEGMSFKNINLHVKEGEFIAILGYSGVGKSTLLNLISGILSPVSGTIFVKNNSITSLPQNKKDQFRAN